MDTQTVGRGETDGAKGRGWRGLENSAPNNRPPAQLGSVEKRQHKAQVFVCVCVVCLFLSLLARLLLLPLATVFFCVVFLSFVHERGRCSTLPTAYCVHSAHCVRCALAATLCA